MYHRFWHHWKSCDTRIDIIIDSDDYRITCTGKICNWDIVRLGADLEHIINLVEVCRVSIYQAFRCIFSGGYVGIENSVDFFT